MKQKKVKTHDKDNAIVLSQFTLDILAYLARSNPNADQDYCPYVGYADD